MRMGKTDLPCRGECHSACRLVNQVADTTNRSIDGQRTEVAMLGFGSSSPLVPAALHSEVGGPTLYQRY